MGTILVGAGEACGVQIPALPAAVQAAVREVVSVFLSVKCIFGGLNCPGETLCLAHSDC
jgi:hypothetical protein